MSNEASGGSVGSSTDQAPLEAIRRHELCNALMAAEAATQALRNGPRTIEDADVLLDGLSDSLAAVRSLATTVGVPVAPIRLEALDLAEVLRGQVAVLRERGARVRVAVSSDTGVRACRRRLGQVIENLLSNALRHGCSADGRALVDIAVIADGDTVRVSVQDRGPGLPPTQAQRLQRGADSSPMPDSDHGLGLVLSMRMARAMGGDLWYEPRDGGGACLSLSLSRARRPVLDERQEVVQAAKPRHDLAIVVQDGRAVTALGGQVVEADHHVGLDGGSPGGPQRDPVPAGRWFVDEDHLEVGLQQHPQAVGQQGRTGTEGDVVGAGRGVRVHASSGAQRG